MEQEESRALHKGSLHEYEDDISLPDFFGMLYRGWRLIAAFTFVGAAAATIAAYLMTPIYRAQVLLAPVTEEQSGALSKLSGTFGDLAELAGLNVGGAGSTKEEAIALLKSRMLTEQFIREENLMPVLFAEKWDAERADWLVERPEDIPTLGDAFKLWDQKIRRIDASATSMMVTLSIDWRNRELAAKWASELVRRVNELMRTRAIVEAEKSIEYVKAELARTSVVEVQVAIYRMIESQIKNMTLAKVREEYFFRVIDPAVVPDADDFVEPKRLLMIIVGFVGGAILGLMAVIMKNALHASRGAAAE